MVPPSLASLPQPLTLAAAANYELTAAPYFEALSLYPSAISDALKTKAPLEALIALYDTTNPLTTAAAFAIGIIPLFYIVSEVNRNYSQVDRVWSILPTIINGHYALWKYRTNNTSGPGLDRVDLAALVLLVWTVCWHPMDAYPLENHLGLTIHAQVRLSFNYWRRGGYQIGSEDYRWEIIKKNIGPFFFSLFNVFFISSAQSVSCTRSFFVDKSVDRYLYRYCC